MAVSVAWISVKETENGQSCVKLLLLSKAIKADKAVGWDDVRSRNLDRNAHLLWPRGDPKTILLP